MNFKNKRRRIDLIAIVVIIVVVVIIRLQGQKGNTDAEDITTVFERYEITIYDYDGGEEVVEINDNFPYFTPEETSDQYYIHIESLDTKGRAQGGIMSADEEHMAEGERPDISGIKPSGWQSDAIYQRSHLLMWKLSNSCDAENLVTGTAHFNQDLMLEYEEKVTEYLWTHKGNHVMYRVTPLFYEKEMVCRGVLMEAESVEDDGAFHYCVFVYNVEPGYYINYLDGLYVEAEEDAAA